MANIRYSLLMSLLSLQVLGLYANTNLFTRHELVTYLTNKSNYDPDYPPGFYDGAPNNVTVQLEVVDLMSISEQKMEYTATMIVRMQWKDDRLGFSEPANFDHLELTGDTVKLVWRPDLYISSERQTVALTFLKYEQMAYIYPTGEVRFSIRISMKHFCNMVLRYYPFDEQNCEIRIESYAFTTDMLMLEWFKKAVLVKNLKLPNFEVFVGKNDSGISSNENGSLIDGTFSYLRVDLTFKRKSSAYGSMYFAPYPLFFMIAMSSFAFKDQISSRITLCTTGITISVLQWIGIYAKLPPVWYLTYLDGWILAHVCLIGLILVYHAFWYMCLHQAHQEQDQFEELLRENLAHILLSEIDAEKSNETHKKQYQIDDGQFVKSKVNGRKLKDFLDSITDESQKKLLTSDKRFKIISTRQREYYFEGYVDRLGRNRIVKAVKKNALDFSVFLIFVVVYPMLLILFAFWAEFSKNYLLFLLFDVIPGGGLIGLVVSHLYRKRNCCKRTSDKADHEAQKQSNLPYFASNEATLPHDQGPQTQRDSPNSTKVDMTSSSERGSNQGSESDTLLEQQDSDTQNLPANITQT